MQRLCQTFVRYIRKEDVQKLTHHELDGFLWQLIQIDEDGGFVIWGVNLEGEDVIFSQMRTHNVCMPGDVAYAVEVVQPDAIDITVLFAALLEQLWQCRDISPFLFHILLFSGYNLI